MRVRVRVRVRVRGCAWGVGVGVGVGFVRAWPHKRLNCPLLPTPNHVPCGHGVTRVGIEDDHRVEVHARDEEGLG